MMYLALTDTRDADVGRHWPYLPEHPMPSGSRTFVALPLAFDAKRLAKHVNQASKKLIISETSKCRTRLTLPFAHPASELQ
jgi:hypothetical protein